MAFTQITASGVAPLAVGNGKLADNAVSTAKIIDLAVTEGKLADGAVTAGKLADNTVGTAKLVDLAVTAAKLADGAVTPAKLAQKLTLATAQATTSGTAITFTGFPAWTQRFTVLFDKVSTNGAAIPEVRIGPVGGIEASGYVSGLGAISAGAANASSTTGVPLGLAGASYSRTGALTFSHMGGNKWVCTGIVSYTDTGAVSMIYSIKTLAGTLERLTLTTTNGTDAFDAGSVNILYE